MFGLSDLIGLVISSFIILPVVTFLREAGYFVISGLFGVKNARLTIGSGPRLFQLGVLDIRKYYHVNSWFSFDSVKRKSNFAYICIYAGPILINVVVAVTMNALIANGFFEDSKTFWNRFIFYAFYFVLYDSIPMKTVNGKPNNGMIIYELLRYGKRVDFNEEPIIPGTTEADEMYQEEVEKIEKIEEEIKEEIIQNDGIPPDKKG
ncbi:MULTISPECIES: hypothetical protein [unclassified Sporosarcina]|uniref:hypothetical protein n=1 Tax=unclassified Sporosarcina TaxID=2647733 RepID=UPI000C169CE6|nr:MULTISPECIES: hypothetical protein [unclassified Sporosarcina]PID04925.1 hypothetical protein CSV66_12760 [Sporosarcina sp. P30]PID08185.1 hypothetical protein CSV65_12425 [Sporosarcina sp. P31]PID11265.1 hypothetical protein CSV64_12995 [Sporosarcina sp. P32b]